MCLSVCVCVDGAHKLGVAAQHGKIRIKVLWLGPNEPARLGTSRVLTPGGVVTCRALCKTSARPSDFSPGWFIEACPCTSSAIIAPLASPLAVSRISTGELTELGAERCEAGEEVSLRRSFGVHYLGETHGHGSESVVSVCNDSVDTCKTRIKAPVHRSWIYTCREFHLWNDRD